MGASWRRETRKEEKEEKEPVEVTPDKVVNLFLVGSMQILEFVKGAVKGNKLILFLEEMAVGRLTNLNFVTLRPLGRIPSARFLSRCSASKAVMWDTVVNTWAV